MRTGKACRARSMGKLCTWATDVIGSVGSPRPKRMLNQDEIFGARREQFPQYQRLIQSHDAAPDSSYPDASIEQAGQIQSRCIGQSDGNDVLVGFRSNLTPSPTWDTKLTRPSTTVQHRSSKLVMPVATILARFRFRNIVASKTNDRHRPITEKQRSPVIRRHHKPVSSGAGNDPKNRNIGWQLLRRAT